jgi:hypothetical protein
MDAPAGARPTTMAGRWTSYFRGEQRTLEIVREMCLPCRRLARTSWVVGGPNPAMGWMRTTSSLPRGWGIRDDCGRTRWLESSFESESASDQSEDGQDDVCRTDRDDRRELGAGKQSVSRFPSVRCSIVNGEQAKSGMYMPCQERTWRRRVVDVVDNDEHERGAADVIAHESSMTCPRVSESAFGPRLLLAIAGLVCAALRYTS